MGSNPIELYGKNVFNESEMKKRLPKAVFKEVKKTMDAGQSLSEEVADVVANAMKDWATERGATHYTHWFQPMTGFTAEKHDSFISPKPDGTAIMEFSGKELIKGEPDASSFPSGGLRVTFEARGYTAWDCTSPAFLKEDTTGLTLCIPTAFVSYYGHALDKKTPLLRSMQALNKQAMRILKALGNPATKVITTVGPEQEYFLIDKGLFKQRRDLVLTGRTLFGAAPAKGQDLDDHYFGAIKERIAAFMNEFDKELWKLGVTSKTKHNEVAPAQHEMAPLFTSANVATDHNQLVMEILQKIANRHGLACLLHEKPFAGVNGSGKHNNWSMATDTGQNLLEPGNSPHDNMQFLLFLCAVIKAVDKYQDLLRVSAANAGNDHRLGANEAPPAIISIFLGDQLTDILEQIKGGDLTNSKQGGDLVVGVTSLPPLPRDNTDRNRTSPFAFTGNKFEFRMVASSASISGPNIVLNTIVADVLEEIAMELEASSDIKATAGKILKDIVAKHERIIFNGDGYSEDWVTEAEKRGLSNLRKTPDALPKLISPESEALFAKHGVFDKEELYSRYEIMMEQYVKTITIEALSMIQMAKRQILPAGVNFVSEVAGSINSVQATGIAADTSAQEDLLVKASALLAEMKVNIAALEDAVAKSDDFHGDSEAHGQFCATAVVAAMDSLRVSADQLEGIVDSTLWPFPTYTELLYNIQ